MLVALAILLIALSPLYGSMAGALQIGRTTNAWDLAVSRAQSRLALIDDPGVLPPEQSGDDGGGYTWRVTIVPLGAAPPPVTARHGPWARGTGLYGIDVVISWNDGRARQRYVLSSARLGTVPEQHP